MNPDGTLAILDRSKDIIISGGEVGLLLDARMKQLVTSSNPQNASSLAIEQGMKTSHVTYFFSSQLYRTCNTSGCSRGRSSRETPS